MQKFRNFKGSYPQSLAAFTERRLPRPEAEAGAAAADADGAGATLATAWCGAGDTGHTTHELFCFSSSQDHLSVAVRQPQILLFPSQQRKRLEKIMEFSVSSNCRGASARVALSQVQQPNILPACEGALCALEICIASRTGNAMENHGETWSLHSLLSQESKLGPMLPIMSK